MPESKIAVIGSQRIIVGFKIAGLASKDQLMFSFENDCEYEMLKNSFECILSRKDVGLILIMESFYKLLRNEIEGHKSNLPSILMIPDRH